MSRGSSRRAPIKMTKKNCEPNDVQETAGGPPKMSKNIFLMTWGILKMPLGHFQDPQRHHTGAAAKPTPHLVAFSVLELSWKHFQNNLGHSKNVFGHFGRPTSHFLNTLGGPLDVFGTFLFGYAANCVPWNNSRIFWDDFRNPGL